jgi:hypothetical protein
MAFLGFFSHPDFAHRRFARRHIEHDGNFAVSRHGYCERIIANNVNADREPDIPSKQPDIQPEPGPPEIPQDKDMPEKEAPLQT